MLLTQKFKMRVNSLYLLTLILYPPAEYFICSSCFEFDQNHLGVSYRPYVKQAHNGDFQYESYTYENIKTMLTVVSGKFAKIFVRDIYAVEDEYIYNYTYWYGSYASLYSGEVAARINEEKGKPVLTVLYEAQVSESVKVTNTDIQLVFEAAKKANAIYPGTVEGVIFGRNTNPSKMQQTLNNLNTYRKSASKLQLKIGADVQCQALLENNNNDLVNLQKRVIAASEIVTCGLIIPETLSQEPVASFKSITKRLLTFREIITNINSNVTVIANLEWTTFGARRWETAENLRLYWESVSKFASKEKYTVHLEEAFDNPYRIEPYFTDAHVGWWKLKNNSQINSVEGYVEKISAAPENRKFHGAVIVDPNVLKSILNLKRPLYYTQDNYTEDFLSTFNQFLVSFDWSNFSNNDVFFQLTAEYNKHNINNNTENAIQLWLSFQPKKDITVDLEVIADAINKANSKYPGTVSTVVLNYGSLTFARQTIPLVKQDMQSFSQKFKLPANKNLRLGLQFHEINCMNQAAYTKSLEYKLVDFVLITPQVKSGVTADSFVSIARMFSTNKHCSVMLHNMSLVTFNTQLTISVTLQNYSYSYDDHLLNQFKFHNMLSYKQTPYIVYAKVEKQSGDDGSIVNITMRDGFEEWLRQQSKFNGLHFGAHWNGQDSSSVEALSNTIVSLNLHKLVLSADGFADDSESLQGFLTELKNIQAAKGNQLEVLLLITFESNELDVNKRRVENILSVALENAVGSFGSMTIVFDGLVCTNSSLSSECNDLEKSNECWMLDKMYDMLYLMNYTREITANKTQMEESKKINLIIMINEYLWSKMYESVVCYQLGKVQRLKRDFYDESMKLMCKTTVALIHLTEISAIKMSEHVVDNFTQCTSPSDWTADVSYYLKITGCNDGEHADIVELAEYVDLVERMNKWAEYVNRTVFVNMGIENTVGCEHEGITTPKRECDCGWWVRTELDEKSNHSLPLQNKKSLALKIFERSTNASSPPAFPPYLKTVLSTKMLLMILIPVTLFALLISSLAIFLVIHYKSKDTMSRQEVREFFKGKVKQRTTNNATCESAESEPYNVEKYELAPSSFTIDTSTTLGSGEFGKVHRGSIKLHGVETEAAVKRTKTPEFGKSHGFYMSLKGLISEIKILSYVGNHTNVVSLLGAYTALLRKGDIAVVLELCPLGSLDKYLRSIKPQQAIFDDNEESLTSSACYVNSNSNKKILDQETDELMSRWPREIACGMEFLTSKNIVHADLATRNILLTADKIAKIADFGLSRRLYDYSEYVKRNQGPLPWRWMAPESLRRMMFNEKTDVWAFGVTLWEIYTLGDEPYPGLTWHVNFPSMLERGLRLQEPKFNVKEMYSIMSRCWFQSPASRPTFAEICKILDG